MRFSNLYNLLDNPKEVDMPFTSIYHYIHQQYFKDQCDHALLLRGNSLLFRVYLQLKSGHPSNLSRLIAV